MLDLCLFVSCTLRLKTFIKLKACQIDLKNDLETRWQRQNRNVACFDYLLSYYNFKAGPFIAHSV